MWLHVEEMGSHVTRVTRGILVPPSCWDENVKNEASSKSTEDEEYCSSSSALVQLFIGMTAISWTLACSVAGSCGVIMALFLSSNGFYAADDILCIALNAIGGGLLTAGSAGNAVESPEFWPFVVLNAVFGLVASMALVRRLLCRPRSSTIDLSEKTADREFPSQSLKH